MPVNPKEEWEANAGERLHAGSWSTCTNGAGLNPPNDVAHVQFQSRIAFKLVWCPRGYEEAVAVTSDAASKSEGRSKLVKHEPYSTFFLVDDEGNFLKKGRPIAGDPHIPHLRIARMRNYDIVNGGKYAKVADTYDFEEEAEAYARNLKEKAEF